MIAFTMPTPVLPCERPVTVEAPQPMLLRRFLIDLVLACTALAIVLPAYAQDGGPTPVVSDWWNVPLPAAIFGSFWLLTRWKPTIAIQVALSDEDRKLVARAVEVQAAALSDEAARRLRTLPG